MNQAYNRCLFTLLPDKSAPVYPAVGWIVGHLSQRPCKMTFIYPAVIS